MDEEETEDRQLICTENQGKRHRNVVGKRSLESGTRTKKTGGGLHGEATSQQMGGCLYKDGRLLFGHYRTCTYFLRTERAMVQDEEEKEDRQFFRAHENSQKKQKPCIKV